MTFRTRNSNDSIVVLGDDPTKGERLSLTGELVDIRPSPKYPSNSLYSLRLDDGSTVAVAGSTVLNKHLHADDVGKRVRLTFRGWGTSKSGTKYRDLAVEVDEALAPMAPTVGEVPPLPESPPPD